MEKRRPDKLPVTGSSQVVTHSWEEHRWPDGSRVKVFTRTISPRGASKRMHRGDVP